jgi:hypothetical protein
MAKRIAHSRRAPRGSRRDREDRSGAVPVLPDLSSTMTHFNECLSLVIVCERSLAKMDDAVHEQQVMRDAIAKFMAVYEESMRRSS